MLRALKSFSGVVSMFEGETRDVDDPNVAADLIRAGYAEEVKPATTSRSGRKSAE